MELLEALEKYTVVQLIFAFLVLLPVWGIVHEVRLFRSGSSDSPDDDKAIDTAKIIAETLGGIIANELRAVKEDAKVDQQLNTQEHKDITGAMNQFGEIMERIATLITTHNDKAEAYRNTVGTIVGQLSNNLNETNQVVSVMKTDIDTIKTDLAVVKTTVNNLETRGLPLDEESQALLKQFIQCAKDLEAQLSKVTPAIQPPDSEEPKLKTIPIGKETTNEESESK